MTDPRELVKDARRQAVELADEGVNGTPNLLNWIADALTAALDREERAEAERHELLAHMIPNHPHTFTGTMLDAVKQWRAGFSR